MVILDFERPIFELETKIKELKNLNTGDLSINQEIKKLEEKLNKLPEVTRTSQKKELKSFPKFQKKGN